MKRAILFGIILSLLVIGACAGGNDSEEGKSEVKVILKGDFTGSNQAGLEQSAQSLSFIYHLILTVSASDLDPPLVFVNENYILGSDWTVYVPNGTGRVFSLILYSIPDVPAVPGWFYFDMYEPANPPAERTYDLTGSPLTINIPLRLSPIGYIGSGSPGIIGLLDPGFLLSRGFKPMMMNTPSGKVEVPECPFMLQAYLIDVESGLVLGPALIDMGSGSMPGYWYLGNVPVNRIYQLKIVRPEMGWLGYSANFILPREEYPGLILPVVLNGFKPLSIDPKNFLVRDGDSNFSQIIDIAGGWGVYSFFHTLAFGATVVQKDSILNYKVTALLGSDTVDFIDVYDNCAMVGLMASRDPSSEAARSPSSLTSRAWWYKAPKISSYSPMPIYFKGIWVYIYGNYFDGLSSRLFLDGKEYNLEDGATTWLYFDSPAKPKGKYNLRVLNPRSNSLFPDFQGFSDSIQVEYGGADNDYVSAIAAGGQHTCALTSGGGVKCWGGNGDGELGNGTTVNSNVPVNVFGLSSGVSAIAAGYAHTCALTSGGGVKCWGYNNDRGELGNGTTVNSNVPVNVFGLSSGVSAISARWSHTCALMSGGGVKCWGQNLDGELGNGTNTNSNVPTDVSGLASGVSAISAGTQHTCALTSSGGVKCWGGNWEGQLGDGTWNSSNVPTTDVSGLNSGVSAISAGGYTNCALTSSGGLKSWGANWTGQLGNGTNIARSNVPVDVSGLASGISAISAGFDHPCALTSSNGVKCWGSNANGELGNGAWTNSNVPVDVSGLASGVSAISAGHYHACALMSSGGVKCWGQGVYGELGNGTNTDSNVPVNVIGFGP